MDRILNQIRRIYTDDGREDMDFYDYEVRLKAAKERLAERTNELAKAAENLNRAAMSVGFPTKVKH